MKTPQEIASEILDTLAKEYGSETFVSNGYAYYEDAKNTIAAAIEQERSSASFRKLRLPERRKQRPVADYEYNEGYNDCLQDVKRLNEGG